MTIRLNSRQNNACRLRRRCKVHSILSWASWECKAPQCKKKSWWRNRVVFLARVGWTALKKNSNLMNSQWSIRNNPTGDINPRTRQFSSSLPPSIDARPRRWYKRLKSLRPKRPWWTTKKTEKRWSDRNIWKKRRMRLCTLNFQASNKYSCRVNATRKFYLTIGKISPVLWLGGSGRQETDNSFSTYITSAN